MIKQWKRWLCMCLACLLMLPVLAVDAVFVEFDETAGYAKPMQVLEGLGMLSAFEGMELNPANPMLKEEFVAILMTIMDYQAGEDSLANIPFEDVDASNSYARYIMGAVELRVVNGIDGSTFGTEAPIRYEEACKLLVTALGFGPLAQVRGGYPTGYLVVASEKGLGRAMLEDGTLNWGQAATMLYNALDVDLAQLVGLENDGSVYNTQEGVTLLSKYHDIYQDRGVVTAVPWSSLSKEEGVGAGKMEIDRVSYEADVDMTDLLGSQVEFYFREEETGYQTVCYLVEDNVDELVIAADDIVGFSDNVLTYTDEGDRQQTISLDPGKDVIYNGKFWDGYTDKDFVLKTGNITLVDATGNGYAVVRMNEYDNIVVDTVNKADDVVYGKYGNHMALPEGNDTFYRLIRADKEVDYTTLVEWDVVSARISKDGSFVDAEVVKTKASGQVVEISEDTVTVGEQTVEISKTYPILEEPIRVGDTGIFYLDIEGKIAGAKIGAASGEEYGYLTGLIQSGSSISNQYLMQVFTQDGVLKEYELTERIRLNGVSGIEPSLEEGSELRTALYRDREGVALSSMPNQLIRYATNSEGKVNRLDTATDKVGTTDYQQGEFVRNFNETQIRYKTQGRTFTDRFNIGSSTIVFCLAKDTEDGSHLPLATFNPEDVCLAEADTFVGDRPYDVEAYEVSEGGIPKVVIAYLGPNDALPSRPGQVDRLAVAVIVDKVVDAVDEDGNEVQRMYAISGKTYTSDIVAKEPGMFTKPSVPGDESSPRVPLQRGDIVRMMFDKNLKVTRMELNFDIAHGWVSHPGNGEVFRSSECYTYFGKLYAREGTNIRVCDKVNGAYDYTNLADLRTYQIQSYTSIYRYDEATDRVAVGDMSEALTYKAAGDYNSYIFIHARNGEIREVAIYNFKDNSIIR